MTITLPVACNNGLSFPSRQAYKRFKRECLRLTGKGRERWTKEGFERWLEIKREAAAAKKDAPKKPDPAPEKMADNRERAGIIRRHLAPKAWFRKLTRAGRRGGLKGIDRLSGRPILNDRRVALDLLRAAACTHQEARQIRRAFRENEMDGAEELIQARHAGRVRGEVRGYLDLGRARFSAFKRGLESGAMCAEVIGYAS